MTLSHDPQFESHRRRDDQRICVYVCLYVCLYVCVYGCVYGCVYLEASQSMLRL